MQRYQSKAGVSIAYKLNSAKPYFEARVERSRRIYTHVYDREKRELSQSCVVMSECVL